MIELLKQVMVTSNCPIGSRPLSPYLPGYYRGVQHWSNVLSRRLLLLLLLLLLLQCIFDSGGITTGARLAACLSQKKQPKTTESWHCCRHTVCSAHSVCHAMPVVQYLTQPWARLTEAWRPGRQWRTVVLTGPPCDMHTVAQ